MRRWPDWRRLQKRLGKELDKVLEWSRDKEGRDEGLAHEMMELLAVCLLTGHPAPVRCTQLMTVQAGAVAGDCKHQDCRNGKCRGNRVQVEEDGRVVWVFAHHKTEAELGCIAVICEPGWPITRVIREYLQWGRKLLASTMVRRKSKGMFVQDGQMFEDDGAFVRWSNRLIRGFTGVDVSVRGYRTVAATELARLVPEGDLRKGLAHVMGTSERKFERVYGKDAREEQAAHAVGIAMQRVQQALEQEEQKKREEKRETLRRRRVVEESEYGSEEGPGGAESGGPGLAVDVEQGQSWAAGARGAGPSGARPPGNAAAPSLRPVSTPPGEPRTGSKRGRESTADMGEGGSGPAVENEAWESALDLLLRRGWGGPAECARCSGREEAGEGQPGTVSKSLGVDGGCGEATRRRGRPRGGRKGVLLARLPGRERRRRSAAPPVRWSFWRPWRWQARGRWRSWRGRIVSWSRWTTSGSEWGREEEPAAPLVTHQALCLFDGSPLV